MSMSGVLMREAACGENRSSQPEIGQNGIFSCLSCCATMHRGIPLPCNVTLAWCQLADSSVRKRVLYTWRSDEHGSSNTHRCGPCSGCRCSERSHGRALLLPEPRPARRCLKFCTALDTCPHIGWCASRSHTRQDHLECSPEGWSSPLSYLALLPLSPQVRVPFLSTGSACTYRRDMEGHRPNHQQACSTMFPCLRGFRALSSRSLPAPSLVSTRSVPLPGVHPVRCPPFRLCPPVSTRKKSLFYNLPI